MIFRPPKKTTNRIILLGASNLTLSLRLVIQLMQQRFGGPSEILTAVGHGRAYGVSSQMLGRGLPGIAACGLWQQLHEMESCPTVALLTDIGNDILYGVAPERILQAVESCIAGLQQQSAQVVVTNLPMAPVECLSERRYTIFRTLFYPSCQLSKDETISRAKTVHAGLVDMAAQRHFNLYEQPPRWFGWDGIHVNYWQREGYYRDILGQFPDSFGCPESEKAAQQFLLTWQRWPQFSYKTIFGRALYCTQPSGQLADGSSVYKY